MGWPGSARRPLAPGGWLAHARGMASAANRRSRTLPAVSLDQVRCLWFQRQGLGTPRGETPLGKRAFVDLLERTGGLQLDSVNVVDRAHWLTLWSRFGAYDRKRVERWVYRDRSAFEYWAHEACILPASHLPEAKRRMRRIPELWAGKSWWKHFETSTASRRRVLRRLREEGPLESSAFERGAHELKVDGGWGSTLPKEDKRTLQFLWHSGRIGIASRRHFRRAYDLAERVYPELPAATRRQEEDAWLLRGLSGNGVACEAHLVNYLTSAGLKAGHRRRVVDRALRAGTVVHVQVEGRSNGRSDAAGEEGLGSARDGRWLALPEHLELLAGVQPVRGTTLLSPFDSLLWQRGRAEQLLGFHYRVEIYVPAAKRVHGYYVLPILHEGRLVGRLDPKLHRDRSLLEVRKLSLEPGFESEASGRAFQEGLGSALQSLASFLGADGILLPRGLPKGLAGAWRKRLS